MPLIIMAGFPCSGKSTRAREIAAIFQANGRKAVIINNETLGIDRNTTYKTSQAEKNARASLKAAVERELNKEAVLIADDLNYIKGYRYELFCIARAMGTTCSTVHVDASLEQIRKFNAAAASSGDGAGSSRCGYDEDILEELPSRFERPNDRNRWERPLFVIRPDDDEGTLEAVLGDVLAAVDGRELKPNLATVQVPVAAATSLHEVDAATADAVDAVLRRQAEAGPGAAAGPVQPGRCSRAFAVGRFVPPAELRRIKRQFMRMVADSAQPPPSPAQAADLFMDFLVGQLAAQP